ncbi:hypothetical protein AS850_08965 [Frondihabitans sp. 762G35]|uniref:LmeA family phospholipid-binding protein n=1 Tax=Frondihabitans sp. 762G35 TaxID=1446794 RepID=UPI000D214961|nr:DUF2993 domain-containing protein [Frondihabitans sp. 762G35]ARC57205.1 hypothetical protein AS850_08965 [Frondihabitans sp. 762G35]
MALVDGPKRRRGGRTALIVIAVLLIVLVVLAVAAEFAARSYAEGRAEKEIESSLPSGTTGRVGVDIRGFSVILQALGGSLDDVHLSSEDLVVSGVPLAFTADLTQVPLQSGATTGPVDATLTVSQEALNTTKAVTDIGGRVTLKPGDVVFDKTVKVLGLDLTAAVTAKPSLAADGKTIRITPTDAAISSSNSAISGAALLTYLKTLSFDVCAADYLPQGATVSRVTVADGSLALDLRSPGLPLTSAGLTETGSCS